MSAIVLRYGVFRAVSLRGAQGRPVRLIGLQKHRDHGRIVGEEGGLKWGAGYEVWSLGKEDVLHRRRKGSRLESSCFLSDGVSLVS